MVRRLVRIWDILTLIFLDPGDIFSSRILWLYLWKQMFNSKCILTFQNAFQEVFFEVISTQTVSFLDQFALLPQFSKPFPELSFFIKIIFLEAPYFSFTLYDVWSNSVLFMTSVIYDSVCHLRISFVTTVSIQVSQVKCIDLNFTEKILPFFQFLLKCHFSCC